MRRMIIITILVALIVAIVLILTLHQKKSDDELILYGNVDVRQVDLGFRVGGRVDTMVFEEGDLVEAGTLMGYLDKQPYLDQVKQAEASVESTWTSLNNAERVLQRRNELVDGGGVSQEDYENALSSRDVLRADLKEAEASLGVYQTNLKDTELYAPIEGTILTRIREPGTVINVAEPIYTLSILNPVWIRAYIAEPALGYIYPGMQAEVYTDTEDLPIYRGHIGFISPVSEFTPKTVQTTELRTDLVYRLRVVVDNPDKMLKQGMPVTVKISLKDQKK